MTQNTKTYYEIIREWQYNPSPSAAFGPSIKDPARHAALLASLPHRRQGNLIIDLALTTDMLRDESLYFRTQTSADEWCRYQEQRRTSYASGYYDIASGQLVDGFYGRLTYDICVGGPTDHDGTALVRVRMSRAADDQTGVVPVYARLTARPVVALCEAR